ncbi:hypothetical protein CJU90_5772 [Yarrowia sp. C11]|nr:hypothetical protein CJU90_5772 [Yarrowia sp. C11]KAG5364352.1 hypothetical protein CKK34_3150 [Yarrowia sp. E02]
MNLRTCISGVRHLSTSRAVCNASKPGLENYARVVDSIKNDRQKTGDFKPKKKLNLRKKSVSEESYAPGMGRMPLGENTMKKVDRRLKFGNSDVVNDNFASTNFDASSSARDKFRKRRTPMDKKVVPKRYGKYKADADRKAPRKLFKKNDGDSRVEAQKKGAEDDSMLTDFLSVSENARLQKALDNLDWENKQVSKAFATLITSEGRPKSTKIDTAKMFKDAFDLSKGSTFNTGVAKPAKTDSADFVVHNLNKNYSLNAEQASTLLDIVSGKTPIASLKMKEDK